jgi:hypothetical protein
MRWLQLHIKSGVPETVTRFSISSEKPVAIRAADQENFTKTKANSLKGGDAKPPV